MTRKAKVTISIIGATATLLIGAAWYFDFPVSEDSPPRPVAKVLDGRNAHCYVYSLGGFIDQEFLWRIDATPETISSVLRSLEMDESENIPKAFWRMPPYYWPRTLSRDMKAYRSLNFMDDSRSSDGDHFFLLHDTKMNRAYVWFKQSF
jgi:hypothetical protein